MRAEERRRLSVGECDEGHALVARGLRAFGTESYFAPPTEVEHLALSTVETAPDR